MSLLSLFQLTDSCAIFPIEVNETGGELLPPLIAAFLNKSVSFHKCYWLKIYLCFVGSSLDKDISGISINSHLLYLGTTKLDVISVQLSQRLISYECS